MGDKGVADQRPWLLIPDLEQTAQGQAPVCDDVLDIEKAKVQVQVHQGGKG